MRRHAVVLMTIALAAVLVTGCQSTTSTDTENGQAMTNELGITIENATPYESDGVTFALPADWQVSRSEPQAGSIRLEVGPDSADSLPPVVIAVTHGEDVADSDVDAGAAVMTFDLANADTMSGVTSDPYDWSPWPYAIAATGTLTLDSGAKDDVLAVFTRDENNTAVVMVTAHAPQGTLEESVPYAVLRSLRMA